MLTGLNVMPTTIRIRHSGMQKSFPNSYTKVGKSSNEEFVKSTGVMHVLGGRIKRKLQPKNRKQ